MKTKPLWGSAAVACFCLVLVAQDRPPAAQAVPLPGPSQKIEQALGKKVELAAIDLPLSDVVSLLSDQLQVPVRLEITALEDIGLNADVPVNLNIKGISARSALRLLLRNLDLAYRIQGSTLVISSFDACESNLTTHVYPVPDLILRDGAADFDSLIELITTIVEPDSWDEVGGPGSLVPFSASLVVSQMNPIHREIAQLLTGLRQALAADSRTPIPVAACPFAGQLSKPAELRFVELPLEELASQLSATYDIPILLDAAAMDDVGIASDVPISCHLTGMPLEEALSIALADSGLVLAVVNEVVLITTPDAQPYEIVLYPVQDLIVGQDLDSLVVTLTTIIAPTTWDIVGGKGVCASSRLAGGLLVVRQSRVSHLQIADLLAELRAARQREEQQSPGISASLDPSKHKFTHSYALRIADDQLDAEEVQMLILKLLPEVTKDGGMIVAIKGRLVIHHSNAVHNKIRQLLSKLATATPMGISRRWGSRSRSGRTVLGQCHEPARWTYGRHSMSIQQQPFGVTPQGQAITQYTCVNHNGLRLQLIDYGAIVTAVEAPDRDGQMANLTLGFADLQGYLQRHPYFGATVGRFGNRIANAQFRLDGAVYRLAANNGPHSLHGGEVGFDKVVWRGEPTETPEWIGVDLHYSSPDGEEGYPGRLEVRVSYRLTHNDELQMLFTAETDRSTHVNLTNHCYWNLGGAGSGSVLGHRLRVRADNYVTVDEALIPTGQLPDVADTPLDFRVEKSLGADIDRLQADPPGYDHCFVVRDARPAIDTHTLVPAARLSDPASGRVMHVRTSQVGLQLYTGNFLDGSPECGGFGQHAAVCLEAQHFPDTPNQPNFPRTLLLPGETFRAMTAHRFTVD